MRISGHKKRHNMPQLLSRKDSNLDKQNQNLLCYHYTTRQPKHSLHTRKA